MSAETFEAEINGAKLTLRRPKMGELDLVGLQRGVRMFFTYQARIREEEEKGGEGVSDRIDRATAVGNDALTKLRERLRAGVPKLTQKLNGRDCVPDGAVLAWLDGGTEPEACTRALELACAILEDLLPSAPLGK